MAAGVNPAVTFFQNMNLFRTIFFSWLLYLSSGYAAQAQEQILELYYSGNYDKVIRLSATAIASGDTSYNNHFLKALSEVQIGRTNDAIQTLETAVSIFRDDARLNKMLAGQYYEAGNYLDARSLYTVLIQSDSSDVSSLFKLAEIASFTQHYKKAVSVLRQILDLDSINLNSLLMLGEILNKQQNSGAIVYYIKAYRIYPDNQKVAYALGNLYIQAKMPVKTIPICERILEKDSTSIKFQKLLGFAYYKMGDPAPGIGHFKKAVVLGDSSFFTYKFMGISQYLTVDFDHAIESLQLAVERDSMDAEVHFFLGACLGIGKQKEEAMYHLDKSLELMKPDPNVTSRIYSEQGNIKRLEMEYEKAYELYNKAWESDSTNLMALYLMASILDNSMHLSKEALVDYQRYIDKVDQLPKSDGGNSQIPTIRGIVEDRIIMLKEELFFLDER